MTDRGERDGWALDAHIATVLTCGIAVTALFVGYVQYRENLSVQRSLAAAARASSRFLPKTLLLP